MRAPATLATSLAAVLGCAPQAPPAPVVLEPRTSQRLVFRDPEQCRECHPQHVQDWEGSMHAYAMRDPVFHALADVVAADFQGETGQLCTQCHSVPGFLGGETRLSRAEDGQWEQRTEGLSPVAQAGVSCDVCHQMVEVIEPMNASIRLIPDGTVRGPFADPRPTPAHASVESPLHRSGEVCSGCHNFVLPIEGRPVDLETTAREWSDEYLAGGGDRECQDCHMLPREGQAAVGGPARTIHAHTFAAVDIAMVDFPDRERQRALVEELLRSAVEMRVAVIDGEGAPRGASITLRNLAGHAVPSGVTVERRIWVEATLREVVTGEVVWMTGALDDGGDLMDGEGDRPLDPQLWWLGTIALDDEVPGAPPRVVDFGHRASLVETHLLRPHGSETRELAWPPLGTGPHTLTVRLLMRPMQPHFLRALEARRVRPLAPGLIPLLPTFEMARFETSFDVP